MKKLITAIALIPVILMTLMPPIGFGMRMPDTRLWLWLVMLCGFLGLYTLTLKINPFVKCFAVLGFINTFFSSAPFLSQFAYVELIGCIYLYVLCLQIEDWDMVFKVLWVVFGVNAILFIMQLIHKDSLFNFGATKVNACSISIGNSMQAKSFLMILIVLLIQRYQGLKRYLQIIYLILIMLALVYWFDHKCWDRFCYARGGCWWATIKLWCHHPLAGFGMGTYKCLFNVYATGKFTAEGIWLQAHNEYIQTLFEMGILGFGLLVGYTINLFMKARGLLLLGAILIMYPMMFHFPTRMTNCIPLLILFVVLIERTYNEQSRVSSHHS